MWNKALDKFTKDYFDAIYVPIYDTTTGQMNCYQNLQSKCIKKLDVKEGNNVFCAGVGTGNEISIMLSNTKCANIVGIDYSEPSIKRAKEKFAGFKNVLLQLGNIHDLQFNDESFDRVSCICVLDFVKDQYNAIEEIARILKIGGKLVITYPLMKKPTVTINLLKDSATSLHRLWKFVRFFVSFLPLVFLPKHKTLTLEVIKDTLKKYGISNIEVEIDIPYGDYIISGVKVRKNVE